MSFRRIPFQFTTTDPAERQRELEKRFGFPTHKMTVDNANRFPMGTGLRDSISSASSPRLQHRVPIFVEGYDQPLKSSVDSPSPASENKKSNVRVIPIEVEGAGTYPSTRHRTFSGPPGMPKEQNDELPLREDASPLKRSMQDLTKPPKMKATTGPKVYNIPIKVEGASSAKNSKVKNLESPVNKDSPQVNGCAVSEQVKEKANEPQQEMSEEQRIELCINNSLKKIENVLDELKSYESGVQEFNGTAKDKQYRYLDEMLTRCMLRLDDIDTMGNENLRSRRKNAVKKVQACVDLLESKINANNGSSSSATEHIVLESKDNSQKVETLDADNINNAEEGTVVNDVEMEEGQGSENDLLDCKRGKYEKVTELTPKGSEESSKLKDAERLNGKEGSVDKSGTTEGEIIAVVSQEAEVAASSSQNNAENQVKDVEMVSSSQDDSAESQVKEVEMVASSQDDSAENKVKVLEMPLPEASTSEKKEKEIASPDNLKNQVNEVEMSEVPNSSNPDLASKELSENSVESMVTVMKNVTQESDVEMTDVQSIPSKLVRNTESSDSSQLEKVPDVSKEKTVSINIAESETAVSDEAQNEVPNHSSNIDSSQNVCETVSK